MVESAMGAAVVREASRRGVKLRVLSAPYFDAAFERPSPGLRSSTDGGLRPLELVRVRNLIWWEIMAGRP